MKKRDRVTTKRKVAYKKWERNRLVKRIWDLNRVLYGMAQTMLSTNSRLERFERLERRLSANGEVCGNTEQTDNAAIRKAVLGMFNWKQECDGVVKGAKK